MDHHKVETSDDVDTLLNEYISKKLSAKGISQEEAIRSLDYYPLGKDAEKIGNAFDEKKRMMVERVHMIEVAREAKRLARECYTREGVNHKQNCEKQKNDFINAAKGFIDQDFDWLRGPFAKASDYK